LASLLARSIARRVRVTILTAESATQVLQFRSLCASAPKMTQVFENEPAATQWLRAAPTAKR
jgi:hypothetical protein